MLLIRTSGHDSLRTGKIYDAEPVGTHHVRVDGATYNKECFRELSPLEVKALFIVDTYLTDPQLQRHLKELQTIAETMRQNEFVARYYDGAEVRLGDRVQLIDGTGLLERAEINARDLSWNAPEVVEVNARVGDCLLAGFVHPVNTKRLGLIARGHVYRADRADTLDTAHN